MQKIEDAHRDFWRMIRWIIVVGALAVVAAIIYLAATGELYFHTVIATILGVFFSILLGGGLMAAAFFSDKSEHDQIVTDATKRPLEDKPSTDKH